MGGAEATRAFTFKAAGTCGGSITISLDLNDDGAPLGVATFTLALQAITSASTPFANATAQTIPPQDPMLPGSPPSITVSGVTGTVRKVTATFIGLDHVYAEDLDVLLVWAGWSDGHADVGRRRHSRVSGRHHVRRRGP